MTAAKVEISETNVQIPENPDFDQKSNLDSDSEKLKNPEVSAILGVSDISRESMKFSKNSKIAKKFRKRNYDQGKQ